MEARRRRDHARHAVLPLNLEHESARWVEAGIIDAEQRRRVLALYERERGPSLAVLAILWTGGALVFLGVAFLLGILWDDLGAARSLVTGVITAGFAAGGVALGRAVPSLERTSLALLVIAGLLVPPTLGVAWEDLFGSSGHPLPLVLFALGLYAFAALRLRSRAFTVLACAALFFVGEEVVRDDDFGALFPLVQLGVVDRLEHVFPVVFLSLAAGVVLLAALAGKHERTTNLRGTLFTCALLLGLGPALVGPIAQYRHKGLLMALSIGAALAGLALSVALRQKGAFWVAGAALVVALLTLFGDFFKDSLAFVAVAITTGLGVLGAGSYVALAKDTWLDRLFGDEDDRDAPAPPGGRPPGAGDPRDGGPPPAPAPASPALSGALTGALAAAPPAAAPPAAAPPLSAPPGPPAPPPA